MSLVRAFPEASGGVAQLDLGTLPDYEVIELADLERFRAKVAKVSEIEPRGYFVGSAALRIWMDQANLPVPAEVSGDIDIALVSKKLRDSGVTHTDMDGFTLDRFGMTREDARPEHFTETLYHGNNIRIARLPRLYSYKYREHLGSPVDIGLLEIAPDELNENEREFAFKTLLYLRLYSKLVDPKALNRYVEILARSGDYRDRNVARFMSRDR